MNRYKIGKALFKKEKNKLLLKQYIFVCKLLKENVSVNGF